MDSGDQVLPETSTGSDINSEDCKSESLEASALEVKLSEDINTTKLSITDSSSNQETAIARSEKDANKSMDDETMARDIDKLSSEEVVTLKKEDTYSSTKESSEEEELILKWDDDEDEVEVDEQQEKKLLDEDEGNQVSNNKTDEDKQISPCSDVNVQLAENFDKTVDTGGLTNTINNEKTCNLTKNNDKNAGQDNSSIEKKNASLSDKLTEEENMSPVDVNDSLTLKDINSPTLDLNTGSSFSSFIEPNNEHRLKEPDLMLDIPTQESINVDLSDSQNMSSLNDSIEPSNFLSSTMEIQTINIMEKADPAEDINVGKQESRDYKMDIEDEAEISISNTEVENINNLKSSCKEKIENDSKVHEINVTDNVTKDLIQETTTKFVEIDIAQTTSSETTIDIEMTEVLSSNLSEQQPNVLAETTDLTKTNIENINIKNEDGSLTVDLVCKSEIKIQNEVNLLSMSPKDVTNKSNTLLDIDNDNNMLSSKVVPSKSLKKKEDETLITSQDIEDIESSKDLQLECKDNQSTSELLSKELEQPISLLSEQGLTATSALLTEGPQLDQPLPLNDSTAIPEQSTILKEPASVEESIPSNTDEGDLSVVSRKVENASIQEQIQSEMLQSEMPTDQESSIDTELQVSSAQEKAFQLTENPQPSSPNLMSKDLPLSSSLQKPTSSATGDDVTFEKMDADSSISPQGSEPVAEEAQPSIMTQEVTQSTEKSTPLVSEPQPSTSTQECIPSVFPEPKPSTSTQEPLPSTSKEPLSPKSTAEPTSSEPQASTSSTPAIGSPQSPDELMDVTDSLGLLAESSNIVDDDEENDEAEPEDDDDDGDGDGDDDFDADDESNQMSIVDQSEDSSAQQSETETSKDVAKQKEAAVEDNIDTKEEDDVADFGFDLPEASETDDIDIDEDEKVDDSVPAVEDIVVEEKELSDIEKDPEDVVEEITESVDPSVPDVVLPAETLKESTTAVSKTPETEEVAEKKDGESIILKLLSDSKKDENSTEEPEKAEDVKKPDKSLTDKSENNDQVNIVDLASSDDDTAETKVQQIKKSPFSVDNEHSILKQRLRLNTSEVTIKTATGQTDTKMVIPEVLPAKILTEIFSLDSDEDEKIEVPKTPPKEKTPPPPEKPDKKCANSGCASSCTEFIVADSSMRHLYEVKVGRSAYVCLDCAMRASVRNTTLIQEIKDMTPLLHLEMKSTGDDLVEISDSDSDDEKDNNDVPKERIGEAGARLMEADLADMINMTWKKYSLDILLKDAQDAIKTEMLCLEQQSKEIEAMLDECQSATDKLRTELYTTFEPRRESRQAVNSYFVKLGDKVLTDFTEEEPVVRDTAFIKEDIRSSGLKRRSSSNAESQAKRPAVDDMANTDQTLDKIDDDNVDVSVVKLSAEVAPPDLPPTGNIVREPVKIGMSVFAMRNAYSSWSKAYITNVLDKSEDKTNPFTLCKVRFESRIKCPIKTLRARFLAYGDPPKVRLTIGTRVIALFKDEKDIYNKRRYFSGIIAEMPNPVNNYRYLVFFDDGYAQYVVHQDTRMVCESSDLVWDEVRQDSRQFVREYLLAYPERPMVRLHAGQLINTEYNGKWLKSKVLKVDASLVQVKFEDDKLEWIYRGSTRLAPMFMELQAAERHRSRALPRSKAQPRMNMPYVEYTRTDEQTIKQNLLTQQQLLAQQNEERRRRAVAKKSTSLPPAPAQLDNNAVSSRVVYYTPKNAVKPHKMVPHSCGPRCRRTDVLALKDLRTYNPLAKPLLSGWERQTVRYKGRKEVIYRAPCGRRLRNMAELHRYLSLVTSDMGVDLFDFSPATHCLAEFVLNKCTVTKKDLSHGKENVPVPCVNYYDTSLPEFCSYNTERTPTAGVPLNLDPEFLCGCDCEDDCQDKSKCACWKLTLEGARTIGLDGEEVGYVYKRLPEPLPSGIYECNSRCKCKSTCLNRVAQHPLQLKLQVFKTLNRGWGIRALNDVPKGAFLCVYAGNLLTDATANLDGLNEGDEYLAELDYIEVVEQMKEGYEEDIPDADKEQDKKDGQKKSGDEEEELESSSEEEQDKEDKEEDDEFVPAYHQSSNYVADFNKRLRRREKKKKEDSGKQEKQEKKTNEDCITISDDEEVREPSSFMAQAGMGGNEFKSKHRSVRSLFGKDEACYIMDAKVQGNIGRYLNHSCTPNVFVQNVFVDTHDPRFPWVAFFALSYIKAGTELTWNYNYDIGSVPGKILYCYCGAPNCRGRLL